MPKSKFKSARSPSKVFHQSSSVERKIIKSSGSMNNVHVSADSRSMATSSLDNTPSEEGVRPAAQTRRTASPSHVKSASCSRSVSRTAQEAASRSEDNNQTFLKTPRRGATASATSGGRSAAATTPSFFTAVEPQDSKLAARQFDNDLGMQSLSTTVPWMDNGLPQKDPSVALAQRMVSSNGNDDPIKKASFSPREAKGSASGGDYSPLPKGSRTSSFSSSSHTYVNRSVATSKCKLSSVQIEGAKMHSPHILCPLLNIGNSCYFNSCIQLLAICPAFVYAMWNSPFARSRHLGRDSSVPQGRSKTAVTPSQHLYESLSRLLFQMKFDYQGGTAINPAGTLNSLAAVNPTFEGRLQQDCAEMMCTVLSAVEEEGRTMIDLDAMLNSFRDDRARMREVQTVNLEDSRMLEEEIPDQIFSLSSFSPTSVSPVPGASTEKGDKKRRKTSWITSASVPDLTSMQGGGPCSSPHWNRLLLLMQSINRENAELEAAAQRRDMQKAAAQTASRRGSSSVTLVKAAPYVPPKLVFNEATNTFTGYTVSETQCHHCKATSRSVHDFQLLLLDIPSTEERISTDSWKLCNTNQSSSPASPGLIHPLSHSDLSARPQTTNALRAYEVQVAESSTASIVHQRVMSSSATDIPSRSHYSSGNGGSARAKKSSRWGGSVLSFFSSIKDKLLRQGIDEPRTLKECMFHHFLPFQFKDQNLYHCEACGNKVEATKTEYLAHLPNTLLVHMKRFESGALFQSKKTEDVLFPVNWTPLSESQPFSELHYSEVLDLADFLHPMIRASYRSAKDEEREMQFRHHKRYRQGGLGGEKGTAQHLHSRSASSNFDGARARGSVPTQPVTTYTLVGVVNHRGSLGGGHYTTYARKKSENDKTKWVLLNDEEIESVSDTVVANSEEYILMYRQQPVVQRPNSVEYRLKGLAGYILEHAGLHPCVDSNGQCVTSPLPEHEREHGGSQTVYISRGWLNNAAYFTDPGPIINRLCYCSEADRRKPCPVPGLPNITKDREDLPHVHLVPLEWFYVAVMQDEYEAFYRHYGGNALITMEELSSMYEEQEKYKKLLGLTS